MTKYIALDQSIKTNGYAIFDNDKIIVSGIFTIPSSKPIEQRLNTLVQKINDLYAEHEFDHLFFEGIQMQGQANNVETYKKLAYVQAIIIFWCYNNDIKFNELPASHWRKIIKDNHGVTFGRKRAEQKKAAIKFVNEYCGKAVSSDEADAVCLGIAGIIENGKNRSAF